MQRMLDELIAVNHSAKADVTRTREDRVRDTGKAAAKKEYISDFMSILATRFVSRT
jgi:taurine dioxygenase